MQRLRNFGTHQYRGVTNHLARTSDLNCQTVKSGLGSRLPFSFISNIKRFRCNRNPSHLVDTLYHHYLSIDYFTLPMFSLNTHIDFVGQHQVEHLTQLILSVASLVGFIVGFVMQRLDMTVMIWGGGVALCTLVCVPSWPVFRKHPVQWLKPVVQLDDAKKAEYQTDGSSDSEVDEKS
ncbi:microsomal signal peptidase 12 kDa subunit-domain-containing protein [Paraphysoderma sedebokerense]|nr:microsomal signal peptidase 12 kDa subunit-domain-containing protein [Paraphysoderma sedebokerense]